MPRLDIVDDAFAACDQRPAEDVAPKSLDDVVSERSATPKSDVSSLGDYSPSSSGSCSNADSEETLSHKLEALDINTNMSAPGAVHMGVASSVSTPYGYVVPSYESVIEAELNAQTPSSRILLSFADGSDTLSSSNQQVCIHDVTVSCVTDTCHMFLTQLNDGNPGRRGLEDLEAAMLQAYTDSSAAPVAPLLKPIAVGSVLAVASDDKFYRCQVKAYNEADDTCDIKFVDHGGYTTIDSTDLRQLQSEFLQLPFQAVEVYIAHVNPASDDEALIDIVTDMMFRRNVSIQMMGVAQDGIPIVQAYFYYGEEGQFVQLLTQEVIDNAYHIYLAAHPNHVPVPIQNGQDHISEVEWSLTSSPSSTCAGAVADLAELAEESQSPRAASVVTPESGVYSRASPVSITGQTHEVVQFIGSSAEFPTLQQAHPQHYQVPAESLTMTAVPEMPVSGAGMFYPANSFVADNQITFAAVAQQAPSVLFYMMQPSENGTAVMVPVYSAQFGGPVVNVSPEVDRTDDEATSTLVDPDEGHCTETEEDTCEDLDKKPYEEWSQEDYERYYNLAI